MNIKFRKAKKLDLKDINGFHEPNTLHRVLLVLGKIASLSTLITRYSIQQTAKERGASHKELKHFQERGLSLEEVWLRKKLSKI